MHPPEASWQPRRRRCLNVSAASAIGTIVIAGSRCDVYLVFSAQHRLSRRTRAWRSWLLRSVAGSPGVTQIMYGLAGERRLPEMELPWLPGYEDSRPVCIGNAASRQFQLDVYGEVIDALYHARLAGLEPLPDAWASALLCSNSSSPPGTGPMKASGRCAGHSGNLRIPR